MVLKSRATSEEERREGYAAGITALFTQARDIALATYNGVAAADAIFKLARWLHAMHPAKFVGFLNSESQALYGVGDTRGSNVHLIAAIALQGELSRLAASPDDRGNARNNLGVSLRTLGERERGTVKLEEAVSAFRQALRERTRERVPLQWAMTQNNLGAALLRLGQRERGAEKLEE